MRDLTVGEFRRELHALLTEPETVELSDDAWWERFGDLLDDALATKARERQARRDAERCAETYNPGVWPYVARCVFRAHHTWDHKDRNGKWKNEATGG